MLGSGGPSQWDHSTMIDGETAPATITEQKKKKKENRKSAKDRICQLRRGNNNMDKQKEVGLIKNARRRSLIYGRRRCLEARR